MVYLEKWTPAAVSLVLGALAGGLFFLFGILYYLFILLALGAWAWIEAETET